MAQIRIQTNGKKKHGKNALSFLFNGKRRSSKVAKPKHRRTAKKKGKRGKGNPFRSGQTHGVGKRGKGNPFREGRSGVGSYVEMLLGGGATYAVTELVETQLFPQFNSGVMGYIADIVVGGAFIGVASTVAKYAGLKIISKDFVKGGITSIGIKLVGRTFQDAHASPHNAIAASVRDAQATAASNGQALPAGSMGTPVPWPSNFPPQVMAQPLGRYRPQQMITRRRN